MAALRDTDLATIPPMVARLRAAFNSGVSRPLKWRHAQLDAMSTMMRDHHDEFAEALRKDLGANDFWIDGVELDTIVGELKVLKANLDQWASPKYVSSPLLALPCQSSIVAEPYGVVLIIAPWNYPVSLVLVPLMTALAAGNVAVIKPSEHSVHTSLLLEKLCTRYLAKDAVAFVQGTKDPTQALLKERFDFICYTGNGSVARLVHQAANKYLTPLLLELGGKCPAIVTPNARIDKAARRIVWGKFSLNMGQTCLSPDYVVTTTEMYDRMAGALKKYIQEFYPDPEQNSDVSRIINSAHTQRLSKLLDGTCQVLQGGKFDVANKYFEPTLVKATVDSTVMKDEIFGPILPIITFDTVAEIIEFVNSRDKPLGLYIFSENAAEQEALTKATSSGGVCVNDCVVHAGNPSLPFGGVGESGMGKYHGEIGFTTFSHMKSVLKKGGDDPALRFPPYTARKLYWLRTLRSITLPSLKSLGAAIVPIIAALVLARYYL